MLSKKMLKLLHNWLKSSSQIKKSIIRKQSSSLLLSITLLELTIRLVDHVLNRFYLDSVYQTDEEKKALERILLASPSALSFALHDDTTIFSELWSSWNQLDSSDSTRDWFTGSLCSQFQTPLLEKLIADMKVSTYCISPC